MKKEKTSKARLKADDQMLPNMIFGAGAWQTLPSLSARAYGDDSQDPWHDSGAALHTRRWRGHVGARRASVFPDSEAVNNALSCLIALLPQKPKIKARV